MDLAGARMLEGMRSRWFVAAGAALLAALAGGAAAELKAGSERAAQARNGVPMRDAPKPLSKIVRTLPYGEKVVVEESSGFYARVKARDGATGWVRAADLVEPGSLKAGSGATSGATPDVSAAGRQFDEDTEKRFRATEKQLEAAYAEVDRLETRASEASKVEKFVREGRLGRQSR